ncbi:MAG: hypothetical protein IKV16_04830 [Clostridia bacterium]|nr:hypothetical protein [Clostridia bacterium]
MKKATIFILIFTALIFLSACKHDHRFGDWITTAEPTCTTEGERVRTCTCSLTQTDVIPVSEHSTVPIEAIPSTCDSVGYTEGARCEVCNTTTVPPVEIPPSHLYSTILTEPTCTDAKACILCGYVSEPALGHTVRVGLCTRCHEYIPPSVHLPNAPIKTTLEISGCTTEFEISAISYRIIENSIVISYDGIKTKDEGFASNGKYVCGFSYTLTDESGALVSSGNASVIGLSVGERVASKALVIDLPTEVNEFYTLTIGNYITKTN